MNLMMNFNNFIKLKDFFRLKDITAEVVDYKMEETSLVGVLFIQGKYLLKEKMIEESFNKKIPFSILFSSSNIEVDDIVCETLDTVEVDGRGVEVSFDILVAYEEVAEIPFVTEENIVEVSTTIEDIELIKEEETKRMDELLKSTLIYKEDNYPTKQEESVERNEATTKIKVCYYQNEKELETLSSKNNISLNHLYETNKENDINKYRRVIINDRTVC